MDTSALLALANQAPTQTARKAGIARSTLLRISQGKTQPSLETLQEIALSLGYEAKITIDSASEPTVTFATRYLLDQSIPDPDPDTLENIASWAQRFERWNVLEPEDMVATAGRLSNLALRKNASFFAAPLNTTVQELDFRVASAADAAQARWALSGQTVANQILGTHSKGPFILWTDKAEESTYFLEQSLRKIDSFTPTAVVLLPAENGELIGRRNIGKLTYVADLQAVIDLHSLGFSKTARDITAHWS